MTCRAPRQSGLTLVELLVATALAAIVVLPLQAMVRNALTAQTVASGANGVSQQARFAMQRMVGAVRATAPHPLSAKAADTTHDWFAPAMFCLKTPDKLRETTFPDNGCSQGRLLADRVSAFSVQTFGAGSGAATVIEINLTLTDPGGGSVSLTSRTRLGGGTL